jgi:hypothetical protein
MSTPRNPLPARKESVRTHEAIGRLQDHLDYGTPFPDALAQFVKALRIPREEAP